MIRKHYLINTNYFFRKTLIMTHFKKPKILNQILKLIIFFNTLNRIKFEVNLTKNELAKYTAYL